MKRLFPILLLLSLLPWTAKAWIISSNKPVVNFFASSYDESPYHYYGDYIGSGIILGNPSLNVSYNSCSGSGSLQTANETRMERLGLPLWSQGNQAVGIIQPDDNGGYTGFQVATNLTNSIAAPGLLFNGFAYTNEHGWAGTNTVTWIIPGVLPHDSLDGDSGQIARNTAATNFSAQHGLLVIDVWGRLWTNGLQADQAAGGVYFKYNAGSHPNAPLSLGMGVAIEVSLADEGTNVSLATLDWNAATATVSSNCTISSVSRTGNTLMWTRKDNRLPMAWDVGIDNTNDCRPALVGEPWIINAFWFTTGITNCPDGVYSLTEDGVEIARPTGADLRANGGRGLNLFTNLTRGATATQRRLILQDIRNKNGADQFLLDHNAGVAGVNGWRDRVNYVSDSQGAWDSGNRGDALTTALGSDLTSLALFDNVLHTDAQTVNHTYTLTLVIPAANHLRMHR